MWPAPQLLSSFRGIFTLRLCDFFAIMKSWHLRFRNRTWLSEFYCVGRENPSVDRISYKQISFISNLWIQLRFYWPTFKSGLWFTAAQFGAFLFFLIPFECDWNATFKQNCFGPLECSLFLNLTQSLPKKQSYICITFRTRRLNNFTIEKTTFRNWYLCSYTKNPQKKSAILPVRHCKSPASSTDMLMILWC